MGEGRERQACSKAEKQKSRKAERERSRMVVVTE